MARLFTLVFAFLLLAPPAHAQGKVTVPLDHWTGMLDGLERPVAPAPGEVLALDRGVEGSFQRGVFSGTLRARFLVPEGYGGGRVPVVGSDVSVGQVLLDGRQTSLLLEGDTYTVAAPAPGTHSLELRFFQGREDDRFRRQLSLSLPPAGPTAISVWLPEPEVEATLAQGALVATREEAGGTRVLGQLDGRARLDLSWKRRVADAAVVAARADAEENAVFSLQEALVQGVAAMRWQVREGEADRFDVALPGDVEILDVTGDAVLQWYTSAATGDGGRGRLTVLLRYVVSDEASFAVHFQFPMDLEKTLDLRLPLPVLPEGGALRGAVGVQGPAGLGVKVAKSDGLGSLDARDLPPGLQALADRPLLLGFTMTGEPSLSLDVTRQADLQLTDTIIDDEQASSVLMEDGSEVGKLRLRLRNSTRQYLSVIPPEGATLTTARIDGRPVRPAVSTGSDGKETLLFPLQQSERLAPGGSRTHLVADGETLSGIAALYDPRPGFWLEILEANRGVLGSAADLEPGQRLVVPTTSSTPESSFVIELAWTRPQDPMGWLGHRALSLPSMDVDVVSLTWHVYLPDAALPFLFSANLTQTSNLRYDPVRRLMYFLRDALNSRSAWAGSWDSGGSSSNEGYQSILSQRRGLYKAELQGKVAAGEVLSSFPFTGTRYQFNRLMPGMETPRVGFFWLDRDAVPLLRWGGLAAALALTLAMLRRPGWRERAPMILGFVGLVLVAQVVPGLHRRLLWGVDLALAWELYARFLRERLRSWLAAPPSLRALIRDLRWRDVIVLGALGLSTWLLALFPLLMSIGALAMLLGLRRSATRMLGAALALCCLLGAPARADDDAAGDAAADQQFESVMLGSLGYVDGGESNRAPGGQAAPAPATTVALPQATPVVPAAPPPPASADAEVPLDRYEAVRAALKARAAELPPGAPVVLGSSIYSGRAEGGALALNLRLGVTLAGADRWKIVPIVGEDVVIVSAKANNQPLALSVRDGYHVWMTRQTGEVELSVDLLVPPHGPRGSLEYDFLAARTPVTAFSVTFPVPGLEPRLRHTVRAELSSNASGTSLVATLASSSRIHLVGYRDLGDDSARTAKIYGESLNLLSLGEDAEELFSVFRYSILYAGAREFQILIPEGWELVSADAEGAFRHTLEPTEGGTLLRGETAFPIRNSFEISLRLKRALPPSGQDFAVSLPRAVGLERQYGWLAVEVNGNLKLEAGDAGGALPVDVRQLPYAVVESAVSPLLLAWRLLDPASAVHLTAAALPEKEPASGSVDRVEATTAVSLEGSELTELRITLRNRLRHSLALTLPEGARVRSALLDEEPVVPSQGPDGAVLFPLKRSAGGERPEPFTLVVVLERQGSAFSLLGRRALTLPALDLPVSSLSWTLRVPARNLYSRLYGPVEPQSYAGHGAWYQPLFGAFMDNVGFGLPADSGGASPVHIEIPTGGTELSWRQYWIAAGQPLELHAWYLAGWLRATLGLALALGLALGGAGAWAYGARRVELAGGLVFAVILAKLGGVGVLVLALLAGLGVGLLRRPGVGATLSWLRALLRAPEPDPEAEKRSSFVRFLVQAATLGALGMLGLGLLGLLGMLFHPLAG